VRPKASWADLTGYTQQHYHRQWLSNTKFQEMSLSKG